MAKIKFQTSVLASGSKGNSVLIRTEKTNILLDAGLSGKKIISALQSIGINEHKIDAIVISHEHNDHISAAGILCRKLHIPLYITTLTYSVCRHKLKNIPAGVRHFSNGKTFKIGNIEIRAFQSSHDVVDGSNFTFKKENYEKKLAVATDVGFPSNLMVAQMKNATTVIMESNHDVKMLLNGQYPPQLKQRIKGKQGHLSNEQAVEIIAKIIHPKMQNLVLAHLSEENNCPQKAEKLMQNYLHSINHDLELIVATHHKATKLLQI